MSVLETYNTKSGEWRVYLDGKRVSYEKYHTLEYFYPVKDCFWSEQKGTLRRYHHYMRVDISNA